MGSLGNLSMLELFNIYVRPEDVEILGEITSLLFLNLVTAGGTSGTAEGSSSLATADLEV